MALVCCSALGVGFYGNYELHNGIEGLSQTVGKMDAYVGTALNQVKL